MIKHYFQVAVRNFFRNKLFTVINLMSLSFGLGVFFLFLLYYLNETSHDEHNKLRNSIYRVYEWSKDIKGGDYRGDAALYMPLGPSLKKEFPDVLDQVRIKMDYELAYVWVGEYKNTIRCNSTYADSTFFRFFPFHFVHGSPSAGFRRMNDVVLNERVSKALFGSEDPVGQVMTIKTSSGTTNFVVGGVVEDIPNSSISFDLLINMLQYESTDEGRALSSRWDVPGFQNFILLSPQSSLPSQPGRMQQFRNTVFPDERQQYIDAKVWDGKGLPPVSFELQPLSDVYENNRINAPGMNAHISRSSLWLLFFIASGMLFIGCVNFTTLAIGRSSRRSKEIAVRKVIGGSGRQLMLQFMMESFVLSWLAGILAVLLVWVVLPSFNQFMGTRLTLKLFYYHGLLWAYAGVLTVAGLLAGTYPALVLSSLKVVTIFKNQVRFNGSNLFTKALVLFQYIISIFLIIGTIIIYQQLNYIRHKDIGIDKDNVLMIDASFFGSNEKYHLFKQALSNTHEVAGITSAQGKFGQNYNTSGFNYAGKHHEALSFSCDVDFLSVIGMHLVTGRQLDPFKAEDSVNSVIVNEAFVRDLAMSDSAIIGMKIAGFSANPLYDPVVVGVVADYNLLPIKEQIKPTLFRRKHGYQPTQIYVRLAGKDVQHALAVVKKAWNSTMNDYLFDYVFIDQFLYSQYEHEARLGLIVILAASVAIFLATLGVIGISYLSSENRLKELTIRKVFGGSWLDITFLVSSDFLKLVFFAFVVAAPASWIVLHKWLQNFAYRIEISVWIFIVTALACLLLTYLFLSITLLKAIFVKPASVLKQE